MELTKEFIKKTCKENKLYNTPSINDKLYLHYKGFRKIQNLDEYTGLKVLWLEGNGLSKIEGLEHQDLLKTLYLQENLIEKIEGLENQIDLDTLNLCKNYVKRIEGLDHMPHLTTLLLGNNCLKTAEDVKHVLQCPSLQTLDIQHNKLEDPGILEVISQVPDLRVLYLMGNPVVKKIRHYRKTIISRCKALRYLDDRPVFDDERRRCDAWGVGLEAGGVEAAQEAEREELRRIREEKKQAEERQFKMFEKMMRDGAEVRKKREAEKAEAAAKAQAALQADPAYGEGFFAGEASSAVTGTAPKTAPAEEEINPFSGEVIIPTEEHESLKAAREERMQGYIESAEMAEAPVPVPPAPPTADELLTEVSSVQNMVVEVPEHNDDGDMPLPPPPSREVVKVPASGTEDSWGASEVPLPTNMPAVLDEEDVAPAQLMADLDKELKALQLKSEACRQRTIDEIKGACRAPPAGTASACVGSERVGSVTGKAAGTGEGITAAAAATDFEDMD
ncbi:unnamed protein product [Chrysoparadoxa australica]